MTFGCIIAYLVFIHNNWRVFFSKLFRFSQKNTAGSVIYPAAVLLFFPSACIRSGITALHRTDFSRFSPDFVKFFLNWNHHGITEFSCLLSRSISCATAVLGSFPSKRTLFTCSMIGSSTWYFSDSFIADFAE